MLAGSDTEIAPLSRQQVKEPYITAFSWLSGAPCRIGRRVRAGLGPEAVLRTGDGLPVRPRSLAGTVKTLRRLAER